MGQFVTVSTDKLAQGELTSVWKSWLSSYVGRAPEETSLPSVIFEPESTQNFRGCIEYGDLGDSGICRVVSSTYKYSRNCATVDNQSPCLVVLQTRGTTFVRQETRKCRLFPGDWSIYDATKPFSITGKGATENVVLRLREEKLAGLYPALAKIPDRSFGRDGIECTVRDLISSSFRDSHKMNFSSGNAVASSLIRLICSAIEEAVAFQKTTPSDLNAQIIDFINANLSSENLRVGMIADAFGCSTRQIHRAFHNEAGMTISEFIWKSRLERTFQALRNPDLKTSTITDIAFEWGFNSAAHFSRMFKDAYGITPREFRFAKSRGPSVS